MSAHTAAQLLEHVLNDLGLDGPVHHLDFSLTKWEFRDAYFAYNLVRKLEPYDQKEDVPREVLWNSLRTFSEAENQCLVMNRFGKFYSPIDRVHAEFLDRAISLARSRISFVLMERWPDWDDLTFTGGASKMSSRRWSHPALKQAGFSERGNLSATTSALDFCRRYATVDFDLDKVTIVDSSRFDYVQKTAKAVRFMAIEPEVNMLLQKGIGDAIRAGLRSVGIDLNNQKTNQDLARLGAYFDTRATLDLSSASDCVSLALLEMLLPERYVDWIMACRTGKTEMHALHKVATMGNGFIFELQSLIFYGLAYAVTQLMGGRESDLSVYGDDIIVSTQCAVPLMELLVYLGLIPNSSKSYWKGPFRESCGKHYFEDLDVTPFYVKDSLSTLHALFRCYNGIREFGERRGLRLVHAEAFILGMIPRSDRVIVPSSYSNRSGLQWPCSGCIFPKRKMKLELGHIVRSLSQTDQDITSRLDDEVKYLDWLRYGSTAIVDDSAWVKLHAHVLKSTKRRLFSFGFPCEKRAYGRGLGMKAEWKWTQKWRPGRNAE